MARFRPPSEFTIVSVAEAPKLTGLDIAELESTSQVQRLTTVAPDGRREDSLRVPRALLLEADADEQSS
jgi:hypothetical protein